MEIYKKQTLSETFSVYFDIRMIKQIVTPLPEVVDRYTIARLKLERLDDTQIDVDSMKEEIEYYKSGIDFENEKLSELTNELYLVNGRIWDTESSIRMGLDKQMTLNEVGSRALRVRDLNRIRMKVKNDIIDLTGNGFKDCKMNYAGSDE